MSQSESHQGTTEPIDSPPEPTYAERARTLMHVSRIATLCTTSQRHPEWPFGSVVAYGLDDHGNPSLLISNMAMHTKNLMTDPRVSLLVTPPDKSGDPLGTARVTVMGRMSKIPKGQSTNIRNRYLARHENAAYWVNFADFHFYMMDTIDVYYVGGFGAMGWVTASDYHGAKVDPLATAESDLINQINAMHSEKLLLMGKTWGEPDTVQATVTAIDRLGLHLRLKTPARFTSIRLPFPNHLESPEEVQAAFFAMVKQAKDGKIY